MTTKKKMATVTAMPIDSALLQVARRREIVAKNTIMSYDWDNHHVAQKIMCGSTAYE
jgi:hypothetical protein